MNSHRAILCSRVSPSSRNRICLLAKIIPILVFVLTSVPRSFAQSCPTVPTGSHTISASVSNSVTGIGLAEGAVFPTGGTLRLDAHATTSGGCQTVCNFYPNDVNHIAIWADISTNAGSYSSSVGNIFGINENGTTAYLQDLDSHSANSTGAPVFGVAAPGTYTFYFQGIIDRNPNCPSIPDHTDIVSITVTVGAADNAQNRGECDECACKVATTPAVGKPINVTTGNMYLQQTDYTLPGIGSALEINRTYNSQNQSTGLFGFGWSSLLDESLVTYGSLLLRINLPDGGAVYFSRSSTSDPFTPKQRLQAYRDVVQNSDNTYTLTFRDGSTHQFNAT